MSEAAAWLEASFDRAWKRVQTVGDVDLPTAVARARHRSARAGAAHKRPMFEVLDERHPAKGCGHCYRTAVA